MLEIAKTNDLLANTRLDDVIRDALTLPQVACNVSHFFGPGIYIKECRVPAGTYAIGELHKTSCTNILSKGRVSVIKPDGSVTELIAPMIFVSEPARNIGYFHEDTVWQNVYATSETDLTKLDEMFIDKNIALIELNEKRKEEIDVTAANADYLKLLEEFGMSEEHVQSQVNNTSDLIPMPFGSYKFTMSPSAIHGQGLFAVQDIQKGEIIGKARISGCRTPLGRYTNHSATPNAYPEMDGNGGINLIARSLIIGSRGGLDGEEITLNYRESRRVALELDREVQSCLHS